MKLKAIYQAIVENIDNVRLVFTDRNISGQVYAEFSHLEPYRVALHSLSEVGIKNHIIDFLFTSELFSNYAEPLRVPIDRGRVLAQNTDLLRTLLEAYRTDIASMVKPSEPHSVYVHIENITSFGELESQANIFHKIFTLSVLQPGVDGTIEIKYVENGSFELEVFVGSLTGVKLLGSLMKGALELLSFKKLIGTKEQFLKSQKLQNDSKEIENRAKSQALATYELFHETIRNRIVSNIESELFTDESIERTNALLVCTKLLCEEIHKGNTISPAQNNPPEIKSLFPSKSQILEISKELLKIAAKMDKDLDDPQNKEDQSNDESKINL